MAMDETTNARRLENSRVSLYHPAMDPVAERNFPEFEPAVSPVNAAGDFLGNAATRSLFEAIDNQRLSVLNVLGIVRCIHVGVTNDDDNPAPEISTAFELLEREIQRVAAALEKISLRGAMRLICT